MESHNHHNADVRRATKRSWQYSLIGLLAVTTIISICLAFGVNYPRIMLSVLVVGMVQVAFMYLVEWLMRSPGVRDRHRRRDVRDIEPEHSAAALAVECKGRGEVNRWQFSLRSLFLAITLLAVVIAFGANYPGVAIVYAILALPFLSGRFMAHLFVHSPALARLIMVVCGAAFLCASGYIFVHAESEGELGDWRIWVGLALISGYGALCWFVAWLIPDKTSS